LKDTRIAVGAQNVHHEPSGAYTGEVSAAMLKELGVKYVIIGHSERRQYFGETDPLVNKKVHAALSVGLRPIVCVGESLEQREAGITSELVTMQVKAALAGVTSDKLRQIWAIGTGHNATPEQANEVCELIRTTIRKMYGARLARAITIQYGGSMNARNAHDLLAQPDVDGGLVGGASLKAADFITIVNAANQ
jgi:triosephosphate isomerase